MGFRPHGAATLRGDMLASRQHLPLQGAAGGRPGATTALRVRRRDGTTGSVSTSESGVVIDDGDVFEFACASGGGYGDPLDREPALVLADVAAGRLTPDEATDTYAVAFASDGTVDDDATARRRDARRHERLAVATAPETARSLDAATRAQTDRAAALPLYPGVVQRANVAFAEASGAVLALAPAHWTDGCPVIEELGAGVVVRTYLDPLTGRALHVEAVPTGAGRSFAVLPRRWTQA